MRWNAFGECQQASAGSCCIYAAARDLQRGSGELRAAIKNYCAAVRWARPVLGIGMYPRTFRFLRAVRTHLTTARYVLLAALGRVIQTGVSWKPCCSVYAAGSGLQSDMVDAVDDSTDFRKSRSGDVYAASSRLRSDACLRRVTACI
ncbi:hypothetical protein XCCB100_4365 [Xanthomonas campestris pv. campestris]|uniref:Uncharacterized protein n=1 Tax=Xanthomonas campestris pv. campestris (strain B100) TaxID=509169 RepID=B0RZ49_XANCB|nr:hypothetical protein XCCB100_4365 [Xanthomonas campestris pv. campestris]